MTSTPIPPQSKFQPISGLTQSRQFTFEEYCAYEDGTDNRYELVQGYLQLMTSPAGWHILICEFLVYVFNQVFQKTGTQLWALREVRVRINENTSRIVDVCVNWQKLAKDGPIWRKRYFSIGSNAIAGGRSDQVK